MPELPEVEVICRGLRPHLVGRQVTAIQQSGKRLRTPVPYDALLREMLGHRISAVSRRAKYLRIDLDSGAALIIHLGMTGNLGFFMPSSEPARHDHVRWTLDNGRELRYNDSRRFGSILMLSAAEMVASEATVFKTSGPEPFLAGFSPEYLRRLAKDKEVAVKVFIMNTKVVAGVGNIYANESLFDAGILPTRKIKTLTQKEWERLVVAIRKILQQAIDCGGSTISSFIDAQRQKGYFQVNFQVYGREGEPCALCHTPLRRIRQGGRASYFCPTCQK